MTKTVRSRFNHEIGEQVEGCTILEKRVVIPPEPSLRRLGVYDYVVEVPPEPAKPVRERSRRAAAAPKSVAAPPEKGSFTRAAPEDVGRGVIRRVPGR
jgi:hypothetical protein